MTVPVFDGHNDAVLRLWKGGAQDLAARFARSEAGHIDLEKARRGGMKGGFFALFAPPEGEFVMPTFEPPYDEPLPGPLEQSAALKMIVEQAAVLVVLERAGALKICRSRGEIEAAMAAGQMAVLMHLEGAEPIDADLLALDVLYAAGLRSLGPVWSRPNIFGHGVPFRYPSDPDTGPGLSEAGKRLVGRCAELGMIVDTSHLTFKGFLDVGEAGVPLVATHSNAHTVSPGARNLTDDQLRMIGQTGGMAGLNFGTMFLRADGRMQAEGCMDAALRHLDHMIALAGEDHVGLGSDFDGAPMPAELASAGELPVLVGAMRAHGYGEALIAGITHQNWLNFIGRTLG
ncbi:dipeptidase [Shimia aestuarii]|uniref:Membrane dipeptidase n=1 Tax=Shimia aestuarii TaxID=254406 RepID=A0A1I4HMU1_9RHOB|nr:dipeptidase [Shimia aestuarii]SFL42736.1 membrane dipeptidase [Shimia aestuarii]